MGAGGDEAGGVVVGVAVAAAAVAPLARAKCPSRAVAAACGRYSVWPAAACGSRMLSEGYYLQLECTSKGVLALVHAVFAYNLRG